MGLCIVFCTELRGQLDRLEDLVYRVPPLVIKEFLSNCVQQASQAQQQLNAQFSLRIQAWDTTKVSHSFTHIPHVPYFSV